MKCMCHKNSIEPNDTQSLCVQNERSIWILVAECIYHENIIKTIDKFNMKRINFSWWKCVAGGGPKNITEAMHELLNIIYKTTAVFSINSISANGQCFNGLVCKTSLLVRSLVAPTQLCVVDFRNKHSMHALNVLSAIHFDVASPSYVAYFSPVAHIPIIHIIFVTLIHSKIY